MIVAGELRRKGAAVYPGAILYGGVAFLVMGNEDRYLLALPALVLCLASFVLLRPIVWDYCDSTPGAKLQLSTAFQPGFFRAYLKGPWLWFAFAFNYTAAALAVGGFLFLLGAGLFA